ncbi:alpha-hydroxy acid oxidase [Falsiroseomonas oryziterrae]|uniref:alpha-hydroxy acid oxidase n=1 Tax=Falsiroseomonas oryziterrae TaxID=2911368 RepID=UPI001F3BEBB5|nr:alpha-hydroxy acid oxidase [Roseomonas sp. NPKOSM-4]
MSAEANERFQTLHELVKAARLKLNANIWDYLVGATETETTLRRNRAALDSVAFRPRVLRDVRKVDSSGDFLGRRVRLPVFLASVGSLDSFEPGGAATAGRAASAFGVPIMVSSVTEPGLERSAEATPGPKVFQLYVRGGAEFVDDHVRRAMDAGYDAFAITVDTAHYSRRERDIAKRFVKHWRARSTGMDFQAALSWADIARFRETHPKVTLVLKGIGCGEDAEIAVRHGVQVVYVSNHGGRQLDHGRGSLEVLPEVVQAVGGKARVWMDGGISRGTDLVKAVALGAEMVGIGRLYCYGLAAAAEHGVKRVLELLEDEVQTCLGLLGATSFAAVERNQLVAAPPVTPPHVHSAFPLLAEPERGY